jgi:hypothetical protein
MSVMNKVIKTGVRINYRDCFPLNVGRFLLPTSWLYPQTHKGGGGRKWKSADVKRIMVTLIYLDPKVSLKRVLLLLS